MKIIRIFAPLLVAMLVAACDDGPIPDRTYYDDEGAAVKLTGQLTGADKWPDDYSVSIAAFTHDGDDYAAVTKNVADISDGGNVELVMTGLPADVSSVELCVLNRLRQRVATFFSVNPDGVRDTIRLDVGAVDVSPVAAFQMALLNQSCTACHGATGGAAAGLFLTEGRFYGATVGQPSKKIEGGVLIQPGNAEQSVLSQVINTDVSAGWRQNHADMLNKERMHTLLKALDDWIDAGAED